MKIWLKLIIPIIIICSRWYVHKVWYKMNKRRRYSNTRLNRHSQHWSRKNAPARRSRQTSNVSAIKNETFSASEQEARTVWSTLDKTIQSANWAPARWLKHRNECIVDLIVKQCYSIKQTDGGWITSLEILLYTKTIITARLVVELRSLCWNS